MRKTTSIFYILAFGALAGSLAGVYHFAGVVNERAEIRAARNEELKIATRYLIWPRSAISIPAHAATIEKTERYVVFRDLRTGNMVEIPLCSVQKIEQVR